ncbi:MAG: hypothetical protein ACR2ME_03010 [Acidimicrobiia bacterium]
MAVVGATLAVLQLWLVVSSWNSAIASTYYFRPAALVQGLSGVIYLAIGLLIVRLRPQINIGWLVAIIGVGILLYQTAAEYAVRGLLMNPGSLPAAGEVGILSQTIWIIPFSFIPILFLVYPTGKLLSRRWAPIVLVDAVAVTTVVLVGTVAMWHFRDNGAAILNEAAPSPTIDLILNIGIFGLLIPLLISVVSLVIRWRRGTETVRLQIKWLLLTGFFFAAQGLMIMFDVDEGGGVVGEVLLLTALVALPTSVGIAVTRYRLYEIDRIIGRTVTYGLLTVLSVGTYLGLVFLIRSFLPIEGQLPVAISTLAIAALFNPLRRRVQRLVDRRFNRARYNAELPLIDFGEKLRAEANLVSLGDEIAAVVQRTMQPTSLALWVR